jgi:hypothetical protein
VYDEATAVIASGPDAVTTTLFAPVAGAIRPYSRMNALPVSTAVMPTPLYVTLEIETLLFAQTATNKARSDPVHVCANVRVLANVTEPELLASNVDIMALQ